MLTRSILLAVQLAPLFEEEVKKTFPWWLVLLILAIVFVILVWALTRNASKTETPHVEHGHAETAHAPEPLPIEEVRAPEPVAVLEEAPVPVVPDDLKLIEGIGPKISSLLNAAGIFTFAQLADTPVEALQGILDRAGLRLGDPATWPEQARLAAQGDMAGLQALQDSLKGGRKV